ncbi:hypothetical protein MMC07_002969 [Pseudocyphellaria aurata]|nr:hypothetical protein [Pseudocyphellaria aurata]
MSSYQSAKARRDKQLQELLDGNHFKQALSLCEKSFKKGDKSEDLLVTWVNILLGHPDQARREQGKRELDGIFERSPPISDIDALVALNTAAEARMDDDPRIQRIWERAVSVREGDENLYRTWFKTKFLEGRWTAAQKAAMMYMKKFPLSREPFFWNIITCELARNHTCATETDRNVLGPLAYRFISKAAAEVSEEKPASSTIRALDSVEDILLLLKVYRSQEKFAEALKVLDDPLTGITSRLGSNSWELVRQKIELYELCNLWSEEWRFCADLLNDAHPNNLQDMSRSPNYPFGKFGDDWKVWVGLLSAMKMIDTNENFEATKNLIHFYTKPKTNSRNARLAMLLYYSIDVRENAQLLTACREYFVDFCTKVACFHDLQPYLSCLNRSLQELLVGLIAEDLKGVVPSHTAPLTQKLNWITAEINLLKLDYHLFVSEKIAPNRRGLLRAFVRNCLRLFRVSLLIGITVPVSERRPGDDAAMLAVMALLKLKELGDCNVVFQCIAILEFLLADSKHNYDALLILIRLYMKLGAGSLAIQLHSRLSIKNIQHATISWILYTRISTIHPFAPTTTLPGQPPIDSPKCLGIAIDWHKSAEYLNRVSINRMLDNGQYSMLFDALEVDRCLKSGFAKFMFIVESHRIGRFLNFSGIKDYSNLLDELDSRPEDTRDTTAFPDAEAYGQPRFEESLIWDPKPDHLWLESQLKVIELSKFLQTRRIKFRAWERLRTDEDSTENTSSFTRYEIHTANMIDILRFMCYFSRDGKRARDTTCTLLRDLRHWYSAMSAAVLSEERLEETVPHYLSIETGSLNWVYFHAMFTILDVFRLTIQTLDYLLEKNPTLHSFDQDLLKAASIDIKAIIGVCWANIHKSVTTIINKLRRSGAASMMVDNTINRDENLIGCNVKDLIGMPALVDIASDICSSWVEGLEAIMRLLPAPPT